MQDTDIVVKPRDVMPEGARTLPAAYYVDREYFRREIDALFGRMWICAGRADAAGGVLRRSRILPA